MDDLRYPVGKFRLPGVGQRAGTRPVHRSDRRDSGAHACGHRWLVGLAARHALPPRRLDRSPGGASCSRQPHEQLCALSSGSHRRRTGDQAVRREAAGPNCRTPAACPWNRRWCCSNPCTRAGCRCCARFPMPIGSAASAIPSWGLVSLEKNAALYAWHGRHHVAHITALRERMGWYDSRRRVHGALKIAQHRDALLCRRTEETAS